MQLGNILDVAIGLIFAFLLLGIIASAILEFVAGIFKWRGTYLAQTINLILSNDIVSETKNITFRWQSQRNWLRAHLTPYPAKTYAELNKPPSGQSTKVPSAAEDLLEQVVKNVRSHPFIKNAASNLPSYITSANFSSAMLSALRDGSTLPAFTQIQSTINALPNGALKTTLTIFLADAEGSLNDFRTRIETWFDSSMDRLEGIYKRLSQYTLLILGGILAVALNVNALHLAHALWDEDPLTRDTLLTAATKTASTPSDLTKTVQEGLASLNAAPLPIGWSHFPDWHLLLTPASWGHIAADLAGWGLTMVCVSLGAPFWFDTLQNVVNLRNAGQKPTNST